MSRSNEVDSGGSGSGGSRFDLGSASEYVEGDRVDWAGLVAYLMTVGFLIVANTTARFLDGLWALPQLALEAVGSAYADLADQVVGFWPSVFEASFESAAASLPGLGVLSFLGAVAFVVFWYVVLVEVLEVL